MKKAFRPRLSYANVMATIAVFLALGLGGAYAASRINGKQIKKNSIPANRLTKTARAFLRGRQGPAGKNGQQGPAGKNGATNVVVRSVSASLNNNSDSGAPVSCNPNERATGGGASVPAFNNSPFLKLEQSEPLTNGVPSANGQTPNGWLSAIENTTGASQNVTFYVVCASP